MTILSIWTSATDPAAILKRLVKSAPELVVPQKNVQVERDLKVQAEFDKGPKGLRLSVTTREWKAFFSFSFSL